MEYWESSMKNIALSWVNRNEDVLRANDKKYKMIDM